MGLPLPRFSFAQQTHGARVLVIPAARVGVAALRRGARGVDALVTTAVDAPLVMLVGDCVPLLLADPAAGVVAAVHAGRKGLVGGIVRQALTAMVGVGASVAGITARLGPSICGRCYELPEDVVRAVEAAVPGTRTTTRSGTAGVDVGAGVMSQLRDAGVPDIDADPACTAEDGRYFSYRRDGATGRFAGAVWLASR
ncbi:MAG: purine-nucleoside/S-methyl-5-thioadenosine phosphorylase / adenosine deaminase [Frankiaceae bacterium]|nr:purine-nucleoside/S-methyl-5-thioadenosine phosphorylase / adenosine deaminase [Frankiaceae bacterium]